MIVNIRINQPGSGCLHKYRMPKPTWLFFYALDMVVNRIQAARPFDRPSKAGRFFYILAKVKRPIENQMLTNGHSGVKYWATGISDQVRVNLSILTSKKYIRTVISKALSRHYIKE